LAKINAWLRFENNQFSKISSVALYVKMGAALGCKNKAAEVRDFLMWVFF
jgi:hypothetical protein